MSDEDNFELVRRFNRIPAAKDLSELDELIAPDYIAHSGEDEVRGRDAWRQFILAGQAQWGEVESGIDGLMATDNLVAERWWVRGGTGIRRGITMHRIVGGRIQEDWVVYEDSAT